ncbi:MAG: hypothetical protein ABSC50_09600 [Candidatus Bathyarchaeia archaeon]
MSSKKKNLEKPPLALVSWYNMNYKLLNGLVLPEYAWNGLTELAPVFGCRDLGHALRFAIEQFLVANAGILVTKDKDWIRKLAELRNMTELNGSKPDSTGIENVRLLNGMFDQMRKAEDSAN